MKSQNKGYIRTKTMTMIETAPVQLTSVNDLAQAEARPTIAPTDTLFRVFELSTVLVPQHSLIPYVMMWLFLTTLNPSERYQHNK